MTTLALTLQTRDDALCACAPQIGRVSLFSQLPHILTEGCVVGTLQTLRTTYFLQLPAGGPWKLRAQRVQERGIGVGATQPLLELSVWDVAAAVGGDDDDVEVSEHYHASVAGQFYLRPAPDKPPFIKVGDLVEPGTQLGLVEVMKFFYPLVFEGEGRWIITEILVGDSTSLEAGDPVIAIEPAD